MKYLTKSQTLLIHSIVVSETGGSHGVREREIIVGLEDAPRQAVFGKELYPDVFSKAAVYIRNIIFFHPFVDGNKRTAMTSCGIFLEQNGHMISVQEGELEKFAIRVVEEKMDIDEISVWLKANSKEYRK